MPDEIKEADDSQESAPAPVKPKARKSVRALYVGQGSYKQGVPARDLSPEEWSSLSPKTKQVLIELGLFEESD